MYKRILVPLDGSELAEQVLPHVLELAGYENAEIVLLRVAAVPDYDFLATEPQWGIELRREAEQETTAYLERKCDELTTRGFRVVTSAGVDGNVATTILEEAHALKADLIAMSTHGRSGLARLVMGSVADQVVRHSDLPVLLVHPQPVPGEFSSHTHPTYVPTPNQ